MRATALVESSAQQKAFQSFSREKAARIVGTQLNKRSEREK